MTTHLFLYIIYCVIYRRGYRLIEEISDTIQGKMLKCKVIKKQNKKNIGDYVAIKKINKDLFNQNIAIEDGMNVIVDENIVKEAVIQHYLTGMFTSSVLCFLSITYNYYHLQLLSLTVANTPIGCYITKFYDFFEDKAFYYLVMEYVSGITLKDFVAKAHEYIRSKRLRLKQWKKVCLIYPLF